MIGEKPLVTILTTCYNHEKFIGKAIESVINQSFQDWEMIILDDYSKDNSRNIIKDYAHKNDKIKYVFDNKNLDQGARFNTYLHKIDSKYIAFLDSDDYMKPNRLKEQVKILENNPEIGVCHSDGKVVDSRIKIDGKDLWQKQSDTLLFSEIHRNPKNKSGNIFKELLNGNFIFFSSTIVRTHLIKNVKFKTIRLGIDWLFWLQLSKKTKFHYMQNPLTYYRIHGNGIMQSTFKTNNFFKSREIVFEEYYDNLSAMQKRDYSYILSRYNDKFGDYKKSYYYASMIFKHHDFRLKPILNLLNAFLKLKFK
jgi:teichuronic acid biosynthesis glycosyltransferase TuaG